MELQLALDSISLLDARRLLAELKGCVDIIEIGTPLIYKEGVRAVAEIKREIPELRVLADLKIMDAGEQEARIAVEAGADIVTVLAAAADRTIQAAAAEAHRAGKAVMVDMIGVRELERRTREIDDIGVDYLCVHTAFDLQSDGGSPLAELRRVAAAAGRSKIAVAGGIRLETIDEIVSAAPDIVIVGGGILGQRDPVGTATELFRRVHAPREGE